MNPKATRVYIQFEDGTSREWVGEQAQKWEEACQTVISSAYIHGVKFPIILCNERTQPRRIDLKHHVEGSAIIKTSNGQAIPETEPTILFRGRDKLAVPMLAFYRKLCVDDGCTDYQLESIDAMIREFKKFADENPQAIKQPGITKGL